MDRFVASLFAMTDTVVLVSAPLHRVARKTTKKKRRS
jgi:hypothetical protein